jgi:hypothetical protein
MGAVPNVRGTGQALYPVTRSREYSTDLAQFVNGTEQRFKARAGLTRLKLPYSYLVANDASNLEAFVDSAKGMFDPTQSITLTDSLGNSNTYDNLALDQDTITVIEQDATLYNTELDLHQTQNLDSPPPTVSQPWTFPVFDVGVSAQRPHTQIRRFLTANVDQPTGIRYSWAWYGEGLNGFPNGALEAWELTLLLSDLNLVTLETFFAAMEGRMWPFTFLDPDSEVEYYPCRFGTDKLVIQHKGVNNNVVVVPIVQYQVNDGTGTGSSAAPPPVSYGNAE